MTSPSPRNVPAIHPAIAGYASRHGLGAESFRSGGRLTLRFDDRYRVHLQPAASGRIAITARLLDLRAHGDRREEVLLRLSTVAAGLLREHNAALCIDAHDESLLLQAQLGADTDAVQLEAELEDFLNALDFWTRASAQPLSASTA